MSRGHPNQKPTSFYDCIGGQRLGEGTLKRLLAYRIAFSPLKYSDQESLIEAYVPGQARTGPIKGWFAFMASAGVPRIRPLIYQVAHS